MDAPRHYKHGGIETWDYLEAFMTRDEYIGYQKGSVIKYLTRAKYKGAEMNDYTKAYNHMERLFQYLEQTSKD